MNDSVFIVIGGDSSEKLQVQYYHSTARVFDTQLAALRYQRDLEVGTNETGLNHDALTYDFALLLEREVVTGAQGVLCYS